MPGSSLRQSTSACTAVLCRRIVRLCRRLIRATDGRLDSVWLAARSTSPSVSGAWSAAASRSPHSNEHSSGRQISASDGMDTVRDAVQHGQSASRPVLTLGCDSAVGCAHAHAQPSDGKCGLTDTQPRRTAITTAQEHRNTKKIIEIFY